MPNPVRYPSGVSTAAKGTTLANYPGPDPTKCFTFFEDFEEYANTTGGVADTPWVDTFVNSSSIAVVADEPGGAIIMTNTGADNDMAQIQWQTENFTLATGKKAWFKARIKCSDATQSDWLVGLAVLDTSLMGSTEGAGVTDGIFFSKDDGDTQIDLQVQKAANTQVRKANLGTATTSYQVLGWEWDGARYVKGFLNDVQVCTLDLTTTPTAYLPDTPITVSLAIMNGEGAAKTLTIDYVFAAIER